MQFDTVFSIQYDPSHVNISSLNPIIERSISKSIFSEIFAGAPYGPFIILVFFGDCIVASISTDIFAVSEPCNTRTASNACTEHSPNSDRTLSNNLLLPRSNAINENPKVLGREQR